MTNPSATQTTSISAPVWHALDATDTAKQLNVNPTTGLSAVEARKRLAQYGPNRLREKESEPVWQSLLESLREPLVLLLIFTGILYTVFGELRDAITIFFVIFVLAGIEVFNERRAERAIEGLRELAEPTAAVRREGRAVEIPADQVVPGDVIVLQAGRRVPADGRIVEGFGLSMDESAFTGEAVPSDKLPDAQLSLDAALADRRNMAYAGTLVARGRGTALAVATGMATELGRVTALAREAKPPRTPLQRAMSELSRYLVGVALAVSILVPILGWLRGQSPQQMLLTGLSLVFATVPEEMPIIITMVLAVGAYRLSQQRAIVKRLDAVETVGAVTVIATDKTGTLTENRMRVSRISPEPANGVPSRLVETRVVCNDATVNDGDFAGDPLEMALLRFAGSADEVRALREAYPLRDEFTFDNTRKRMSVVCERDGCSWVAVKGAPESVLACSSRVATDGSERPLTEADRADILAEAERMAGEGLRVLGFAEKSLPITPVAPDGDAACSTQPALTQDQAESQLVFVGLAGLVDPLRVEAKQALAECAQAGIRTIMVTGDHPLTAGVIAREAGLSVGTKASPVVTGGQIDAVTDDALADAVGRVSVYARTTPEHKLRLVRALHARGELVAATGDGINDGPALAMADVGIAMGETGTDVAREAAGIVLADDNFATIARTVREGRLLFANLQKAVRYYLACKLALVLITLTPVLLGVPIPFAPIQIILMELFMDLAASATFIAEPAEGDLMRQPPRDPRRPFMDGAMIRSIVIPATGLFAAVTAVYLIVWNSGAWLVTAQTTAFAMWLLGHVFLAFNLRSERRPLTKLGVLTNRAMLIWAGATVAFLVLLALVPPLQVALKAAALDPQQWLLVVVAAFVGTFWLEGRKLLSRA